MAGRRGSLLAAAAGRARTDVGFDRNARLSKSEGPGTTERGEQETGSEAIFLRAGRTQDGGDLLVPELQKASPVA